MHQLSRRTFLKQLALAGVAVTLYTNRSFEMVFAEAGPTEFKVRILHTNDHHARIEPVASGETLVHGGVSRRKTLIDQLRAEVDEELDVLLLDAGDVFQGTLYFNQYNGLADLEFYKAMQYQAITIGNHEFDKGPQVLADFIDAAADPAFTPAVNPDGSLAEDWSIPVISANIVTAAGSPLDGKIRKNTVITLEQGPAAGKKIGLFGLTPPDTGILSNAGDDVTFIGEADPTDANTELVNLINNQVNDLKAQGCDVIIALTHVGYQLDVSLAAKTSGIALFIGGHSHTPLGPQPDAQGPYPTPVNNADGDNVPVLTDWEWGRWLGVFDVGFDAEGRVSEITGTPIEVVADEEAEGYVEPNAEFEARINNDYRPPLDDLRNSIIGFTEVELNGERTHVRSRETNLGNLIADALLAATRGDGATIAITNGGGIRATIPAGDISVGNVLEVLPFGNRIALVTLTGAQILAALENGVSQVEFGAERFPQVAGLHYAFDIRRPAGDRVTEVTVADGDDFVELDLNATYRVATNDFMLSGGDGYSVFTEGTDPVDTGLIMADEVMEYITANSPLTAEKLPLGRISARAFLIFASQISTPAEVSR